MRVTHVVEPVEETDHLQYFQQLQVQEEEVDQLVDIMLTLEDQEAEHIEEDQ